MYNYNNFNDEWFQRLKSGLPTNVDSLRNQNNMGMGTPALTTPEEGYNRGNLFANLYDQYKNYRPVTLKANNEQEKLFFDLSRMSFAAHEINLYLDLNPDDASMIQLFNDYRQRADQLIREYERKYGPLNISSDSLDQTPFMWEKSPWPWEVRF